MIILGVIGLLLVSYALWIKSEKRQNIAFIIGGLFLLGYSVDIRDTVFIVLQVIFILSASLELIRMRKNA